MIRLQGELLDRLIEANRFAAARMEEITLADLALQEAVRSGVVKPVISFR